jgi:hypothetical protein
MLTIDAVYRTKSGKVINFTSLRTIIDHYRRLFEERLGRLRTAAAINSVLRMALDDAGRMWVEVFLPLRFTNYVRSSGYFANQKYESLKIQAGMEGRPMSGAAMRTPGGDNASGGGNPPVILPQPTPFVLTGRSRALALGGVSVEARVDASTAKIVIRVPVGWVKATRQYEAFTAIPVAERQRVSEQVHRNLERLLGLTGAGKAIGRDFRWRTANQTSPQSPPMRALFPMTERAVGLGA